MPNKDRPASAASSDTRIKNDPDTIRLTALTLLSEGKGWGTNAVQKSLGGGSTRVVSGVVAQLKEDLASYGRPVMPEGVPAEVTEQMAELWAAAVVAANKEYTTERKDSAEKINALKIELAASKKQAEDQTEAYTVEKQALQAANDGLTSKLEALQKQKDAADQQLQSVSHELAVAKVETESVKGSLAAALSSVDDYKARADQAIEAKDAAVKEGAEALAKAVETAKQDLATAVAAERETAKADLSAARSEERESAKKKINRAYDQVEATEVRLSQMSLDWKDKEVALTEKNDDLTAKLSKSNSLVDESKLRLDLAQTALAKAESIHAEQIGALNERIAELKQDKADAIDREKEARFLAENSKPSKNAPK